MKILLVDDDVLLTRILSHRLRQDAHEVHLARNGGEATRALEKLRPDLVLLDYNLPGNPGPRVCEQMRKQRFGAAVPIFILTVRNKLRDIETAFHAGATDYIYKTSSCDELAAIIHRKYERSRSGR